MEIHTGGILMKKIFSVMLSALICICPMNFMDTYAYSFTQEEIESSEIKPQLSFPQINISEAKAKENPEITVSLTLSGAERKYSTAEIWTSFDSRLSVKKDDDTGDNYFESGYAFKNLNVTGGKSSYYDNSGNTVRDLNGIRIIGTSGKDTGLDGTVFTTTVILPDDVKEGDVFPLKVIHMTMENANNDFVNSTFTNADNDRTGKLMGEWLFTNGLNDGFIKITGEQETLYGDVNLDGKVSISDAVRILQYIANSEKYSLDAQAKDNADVYSRGDGVTAKDAVSIQKLDAGVIDSLPEN